MTAYDDASAIADNVERFAHSFRVAARLYYYIEPSAARHRAGRIETRSAIIGEIDGARRAHFFCEREAIGDSVNSGDFARAAQRRESNDALADGTRSHHRN
jgi:hypothetical protein